MVAAPWSRKEGGIVERYVQANKAAKDCGLQSVGQNLKSEI